MARDCLRCGACCFSTLENYVRVSGDDHARLGSDAERFTSFDGHRCFMRMQGGHCGALVIDHETASFRCSVYARRPEVCRILERDSPACDGEFARKAAHAAHVLKLLR